MLLGAGNGLSPDQRQAIAWTNTDLLFNRNLEKLGKWHWYRDLRPPSLFELLSADGDRFVQASMSWCRYLPYIYIKKVIKIVASRFETNCHHCYRTVKTFISMTVCGTVVSSLLTRRAFYMSLINCTVPLYFNGSPGGICDGLSALSPAPVRQQWRYVCLCWSITWRVYRCISNGVMEPRGKGPKWALLVV